MSILRPLRTPYSTGPHAPGSPEGVGTAFAYAFLTLSGGTPIWRQGARRWIKRNCGEDLQRVLPITEPVDGVSGQGVRVDVVSVEYPSRISALVDLEIITASDEEGLRRLRVRLGHLDRWRVYDATSIDEPSNWYCGTKDVVDEGERLTAAA